MLYATYSLSFLLDKHILEGDFYLCLWKVMHPQFLSFGWDPSRLYTDNLDFHFLADGFEQFDVPHQGV